MLNINKEQEQPQPKVEEQPQPIALKLSLDKNEVIKLTEVIERSEDFALAKRLELETTLTAIHQAFYDWLMANQNR